MTLVADANTLILLHGDGTNNSTTITDEAGNAWTANGDAKIDTSQYKFSSIGSAIKFDGNADYLETADAAKWVYQDVTLESYVRLAALPANGAYMVFYHQYINANNRINFQIYNSAGTYQMILMVRTGGVAVISSTKNLTTLAIDTWNHFAWTKDGTNVLSWFNGAQVGTTTTGVGAFPNLASAVNIGRNMAASGYLNGWAADYRVSNVARYTSAFTPQASPFSYYHELIHAPYRSFSVNAPSKSMTIHAPYRNFTITGS
jgi:hypothetical protein